MPQHNDISSGFAQEVTVWDILSLYAQDLLLGCHLHLVPLGAHFMQTRTLCVLLLKYFSHELGTKVWNSLLVTSYLQASHCFI